MEICAATASRGGDPFGEHVDHLVELLPLQIAVRIGGADQVEHLRLRTLAAGHFRDDLLGKDVERRLGDFEPVEFALSHGAHQCGALDKLIAGSGKEASFGQRADPVSGAPDALQGHGDRARRTDLAGQVHGSDIDAKLE